MDYNHIEYKKPFYRIKANLKEHLKNYSRLEDLPVSYENLAEYEELFPLIDDNGKRTLWHMAMYNQENLNLLSKSLVEVYQRLNSDGDDNTYLRIDRIDFCSFGNSKPFRVRVVHEINGNYDYFYMKKADSSRIYGLELEEIFSPDKINYIVDKQTLVEEHIVGIPLDDFIFRNKEVAIENRIRLAKEFVKFNERTFVRLLGDMRAYNYVVEIIQDFDNIQYHLRAMDFDQQCFEGRKNIYRPQFYKGNMELVKLVQELMTEDVSRQYQRIERVSMKKRYLASRQRTRSLLRIMRKDRISTDKNIKILRSELAEHHNDTDFLKFNNMGDILNRHMEKMLSVDILTKSEILK
tara:strand:+ start:12811 stop:13863 length:1053 start_codon:yes stop_codon:yes gene_type:complete